VNKIAPKFITLVATYIYVVRLFKDLTERHIYVVRRLRVNGGDASHICYTVWYTPVVVS